MKINTKESIKDLSGKPIKYEDGFFTIGKALSNILIEAKEGGKMKMFLLAQKCYEEKVIDVDDADLAVMKTAVESTTSYNNLVNGQILIALTKTENK